MRAFGALFVLGALLCSCASTKAPVQVRAAKLTQGADFDESAGYEAARALYKSGNYGEAYTAYQNLILRTAGEGSAHAAQYRLEIADAALALASQNEKFQARARAGYMHLETLDGLNKDMVNRIQAGKTLLALTENIGGNEEKPVLAALNHNPEDARLWNALGHIRDQNQQWVAALEAYVKALEYAHKEDEATASVINNMGMSLMLQGRYTEALTKLKAVHRQFPDTKLYENNYQLVLVLAGRLGNALEGVDDSRAAQLFNDAGFISASRGETIRARSLYTKAIQYSPTYFEIAEKNLAALDL